MNALAFDFDYGTDAVEPAPKPVRRLYAVRGTVDEPVAGSATQSDAPTALVAAPAPSLDVILGGAFGALGRTETVACPVCATGTMAPRWSASAGVVGGRCADCGSTFE